MSYCTATAGLELTVWMRLLLRSPSSTCLCLPSTWANGVNHHAWPFIYYSFIVMYASMMWLQWTLLFFWDSAWVWLADSSQILFASGLPEAYDFSPMPLFSSAPASSATRVCQTSAGLAPRLVKREILISSACHHTYWKAAVVMSTQAAFVSEISPGSH